KVDVENLKVLDPACGSGSFLIKAYDILNQYHSENDIAYHQAELDFQTDTIFTKKAKIIQNNIFGVDLDRQAVEITQLNLLLKIAEKKKRLPLLDNNIKCGNSLISDEKYAGNKAFIWEEEYAEIYEKGGFDVIIGNPPYQLDTGGSGRQAKPIYQLFVQQAKKLKPRFLTMIIPSRWFAGGMGLDNFREQMLRDKHISHLTDFTNAKDCFQGISISGGVNYFLWQRDYNGPCKFTSIHDNKSNTLERHLDEFPVLVRHNEAVNIIHKVLSKKESLVRDIVSSINPFGFPTSARGSQKGGRGMLKLYSSKCVGFVSNAEVTQGIDMINKYKVMISQTISEHAGEPGKDGTFKLFSTVKVLAPREICTFSYITAGVLDSET
ncbi:MAG: Eco57I restriction-modification methylase domain-containing protein, partial [Desulfobacteraceae bacterium]|nr:Eco57I restriction-modification methylase domain-containing protein [Desulfobacteraceae bacterium]